MGRERKREPDLELYPQLSHQAPVLPSSIRPRRTSACSGWLQWKSGAPALRERAPIGERARRPALSRNAIRRYLPAGVTQATEPPGLPGRCTSPFGCRVDSVF